MAKIDSIEDLAEWFHIDNYSSASGFSATEWYRQLSLRKFLIFVLKMSNDETNDLSKEYRAAFDRTIKNMRGIPVEHCDIPNSFGAYGYAQYLADEPLGVISLTFRHLREHANTAPGYEQEPERWFAAMNKITSETVHTNVTVDPPLLLGGPLLPEVNYAVPRVDMRLPTKQLLKGFESWLEKAKASTEFQPEKKRFHTPAFHKWEGYGLLPYLDLLIWQMETGNTIPDRVMAAAVLPRRELGEANLRKTTIPLAKKLIDDGMLELKELAATEAARTAAIKVED